ncbi:amino acid permease [Grosmannia clavigera kw1407]|uniref:Amino acid permease n=1 Tax=Grosmannia clavigera (strain kw1407 / UAMH 11150) TaxID=655863 RepID=F0X7B5_GROCL|nr:amino acid permease [Grosmannia clavigera kw1407]EFX06384.1 amino acid permease [Grosmannia clavigera kw1407]
MSVAIPQDHAGYDDSLAFRDRYRHPGHEDRLEPKDGDDDHKHASEDLSRTDGVSADQELEAFGYTPELARSRSTLQVAFMSFVLAAIPYGLATTFFYPLVGGGATNIIWGWVGVSAIILCVAASLGEITSVYPTSGGVYYQTFMLAPLRWRRVASWICGWLYVVGNITITLSVNFGTALFLVSCINVFETDGVGIFPGEPYQVFLVFLGITILSVLVSSLGNRWLPILDNGRRSAKYVFTSFEPRSGWVPGWSFCVGLLQAAYATSSSGMIISMCEEVQQPATQVPKAMVGTIVLNTLCGLLFLIPVVFVLPDIDELVALASGQPFPSIIKSAVGSPGGAFGLLVPLLVLALICGIGCTTAASRSTWAFSRDGAIPASHLWKKIDTKLDVPMNSMLLNTGVQIVLGAIYFGSTAAFNAFSSVGVICLTTSYAAPIAVSLIGGRRAVKTGSFYLGPMGLVCNVIALAWSLLAIPLFCMPSTLPVAATTMNYASVVFAAFVLISVGWYAVWGHSNYTGPPEAH